MRQKRLIIAIISFWILFYTVNNYYWLKQSVDFPVEGMEALKYSHMIEWFETFKSGEFSKIKSQLLDHNEPLYYLTPAVSSILWGAKYHFHIMLNIVYFALLLISVYLLGKELYNEECGIIAVCLLSLYPGIYGLSRKFFGEFGMMWPIVLTTLMLLKSKYFSDRKYSLLSGIFLGLGLISRCTFLLFVLGPIIYVCFGMVRYLKNAESKIKKQNLSNLFLALLFCFAIAGYRYFRVTIVRHHVFQFVSSSEGLQPLVYLKYLHDWGLSLPFFILFMIALISLFFLKEMNKNKLLLLFWVLIPVIAHSFMLHRKEYRHVVPLLPAISVISALFLTTSPKKNFKIFKLLGCILLIIGLFQFNDLSFGAGLGFHKLRFRKCVDISDNVHPPVSKEQNFLLHTMDIIPVPSDLKYKTKVFFLPDNYSIGQLFNNWVWGNIYWLKKLPIIPIIYNKDTDGLEDLTGYINQADIIVYAGKDDLKNRNLLENYINRRLKHLIYHIRIHDFHENNIRTKKVLKGDYSLLSGGLSLEQIKSEIKLAFSSFELHQVHKLFHSDTNINLYIYTRADHR